MNKENILLDKSLSFAARIVKLHKHLIKTYKESVISRQIIRSGTSIGANINEANYGSTADFINKMQIAQKETAETEYWIRLLRLSDFLDEQEFESLLKDCLDIKNILTATLKTAKSNKK
ncbi:MAG: four helix bundle protein [Firmicutes bacterium]|nr:four helix bundle protein [Bacillota bacterium]